MALEALTGALFGSAVEDPIKNLTARFLKTVQKRGIFAAKQGLANEAPEHYRKITGQDPPTETAGKYTLTKEMDYNHAKVDTKNDVLRAAIDNLDPTDFQRIYDKVEKIKAKEQDRPTKRTRSPTPPGRPVRTAGTKPTTDEITGKAVFGDSYQSPIDADPNTQRPTKKATPPPAPETKMPVPEPPAPATKMPVQEEAYHTEEIPSKEKLLIDESTYNPSAANISLEGATRGALSGVASEVLSTLAKTAFPGAAPFVDAVGGIYRTMNPNTQSEMIGREFSRNYGRYLSSNLFTAPDLAMNRLSTQDDFHSIGPYATELLLSTAPKNNNLRLYAQNAISESKALNLPFPT
jgi:hypothetical protein